jgi:hypothetical protein
MNMENEMPRVDFFTRRVGVIHTLPFQPCSFLLSNQNKTIHPIWVLGLFIVEILILQLTLSCGGYTQLGITGFTEPEASEEGITFRVRVQNGESAWWCGTTKPVETLEDACIQMDYLRDDWFVLTMDLAPGIYFYYYRVQNGEQKEIRRDGANRLVSGYGDQFISAVMITPEGSVSPASNIDRLNQTQTISTDAYELMYHPSMILSSHLQTIKQIITTHLSQLKAVWEYNPDSPLEIHLAPPELLNFTSLWGLTQLIDRSSYDTVDETARLNQVDFHVIPKVIVPFYTGEDLQPGSESIFSEVLRNEITKGFLLDYTLHRLPDWNNGSLDAEDIKHLKQQAYFYWIMEGAAALLANTTLNDIRFLGLPIHAYVDALLKKHPTWNLMDVFDLDNDAYATVDQFSTDYIAPLGSFFTYLYEAYGMESLKCWFDEVLKGISNGHTLLDPASFSLCYQQSSSDLESQWIDTLFKSQSNRIEQTAMLLDKFAPSSYLFDMRVAFLFNKVVFLGLDTDDSETLPFEPGTILTKIEGIPAYHYFMWYSIWLRKHAGDPIRVEYLHHGNPQTTLYQPASEESNK